MVYVYDIHYIPHFSSEEDVFRTGAGSRTIHGEPFQNTPGQPYLFLLSFFHDSKKLFCQNRIGIPAQDFITSPFAHLISLFF